MNGRLKTMATALVLAVCVGAFLACEALFYSIVLAVFGAWMAWIIVAVSAVVCIWLGLWVLR